MWKREWIKHITPSHQSPLASRALSVSLKGGVLFFPQRGSGLPLEGFTLLPSTGYWSSLEGVASLTSKAGCRSDSIWTGALWPPIRQIRLGKGT